jgi:tetratricopeptide (TPR) repeat protein
MKRPKLISQLQLFSLIILFSLAAMVLAVAQEKPQPEKRWVRWQLIEVARKPLADSILAKLQQGVSFQKLARQHSLHASAKEGGEIGWAVLDSVDIDFKSAMASLPIGGTSAILQKGNHFFVLYKMNQLLESGYVKWKEQKAEVDSLADRGSVFLSSYEYHQGIAYFDSAVVIARGIGYRKGLGRSLGNLGVAYNDFGQYQQAIAYYDSALNIARETDDRKGETNWLGNLGNTYSSLGQ